MDLNQFDKKIKEKLEAFEYKEAPQAGSFDKLFQEFSASETKNISLAEKNTHETKTVLFPKSLFKVAASIALMIGVSFIVLKWSEQTVTVPRGLVQTVVLPDNSEVMVNAASSISYNRLLWFFNRELSLTGEAFFKVQKGSKFTVKSDIGNTQVLGTSFNIYARDNNYIVKCFTGKVKVFNEKDTTFITVGEMTELGKPTITFTPQKTTDWRSGFYEFNQKPLKKVFEEIARQYNVEIQLPKKFQNLLYTGFFKKGDIDLALKLVTEPMGLTYTVENNIVKVFPQQQ